MAFNKSIHMIYLILLGITAGATLTVGALVAPVVFGANAYLASAHLDTFDAGLLMTQVFIRYNYLLAVTVGIVLVMEIRDYLRFNRDKWTVGLAFVVLFTGMMFLFYYTPYILQAQAMGPAATQTELFDNVHKGAELDHKILLAALLGLAGRRLWRTLR